MWGTMPNIQIDASKRLKDPIINHKCCKCKETLLQSGSFDPRWPEQKSVRAVGRWGKDEIAMREVWNPLYPGRPMALQFHLTCKFCGQINEATVIVQHWDSSKLRVDYNFGMKVGSRAIDARPTRG